MPLCICTSAWLCHQLLYLQQLINFLHWLLTFQKAFKHCVSLCITIAGHVEITEFMLSKISGNKMILGQDWLWIHNSKINWDSNRLALGDILEVVTSYELPRWLLPCKQNPVCQIGELYTLCVLRKKFQCTTQVYPELTWDQIQTRSRIFEIQSLPTYLERITSTGQMAIIPSLMLCGDKNHRSLPTLITKHGTFKPTVWLWQSCSLDCLSTNDEFCLAKLLATEKVFVYINDIFIPTKDLEEWFKKSFTLWKKITMHFWSKEVMLLQLLILKGSIQHFPKKCWSIADWPVPKDKKALSRFLGLFNFFWCFIANFAKFAKCLFALLDRSYTWKGYPYLIC